MLLTITTTHAPARDLGHLLGKHPDRTQTFELSHGRAHVCFPEASDARCTAALVLDVDPIGLVRRPEGDEAFALAQYTNDRPYVAASLLAVAIGRVFQRALGGRSAERQALADAAIPLEARVVAVPARGGERLLRALFEPLGYAVEVASIELDAALPQWGASPYLDVTLRGTLRLADLLRHITVLLPVLDDGKHYWVGFDEVDKLLARGEGWLAAHPERETIVSRYLKRQGYLARAALRRLSEDDPAPDEPEPELDAREDQIEARLSLDAQRREAIIAELRRHDVGSVIDLGCGEGKLVRALLGVRELRRIVGVDVSLQCLERAAARLGIADDAKLAERVQLLQGSLVYRDARFSGFDAACLVEVIEHVDAERLGALERVVFEFAAPRVVIVTTPNAAYNVRFPGVGAHGLRHRDHRFEWNRDQFAGWAEAVGLRHGYAVAFAGIGEPDPELGAPTQMGVFTR